MDFNKYFLSKAFVAAQLWVFNGFAALSIAFYFSLFSAGKPAEFSISLQFSVVLFGISLVTNASLAFLILVSNKDPDFLNMLNRSKYFSWVPLTAMYSMLFAVVFLVLNFSWTALILLILTMAAVYILFERAIKHEREQIETSIRKSKNEQMSTLIEILKMQREKERNSKKSD
ncbi:ABC-type multidrug transport system fused ATPase/permease subunit [Pantoea sp. PA1]|uniref:hypothetical protein n=1 Tax=Pantoea ananas TaxID=553 RepID=UPI002025E086|nr:hypothetical protein [Pantoea ananatis]MDH0053586.1 hypothetical protein [Pantoea ananatis]URL13898.1 hypothetical protein LVR30_16965 [Pantoea ananatis]